MANHKFEAPKTGEAEEEESVDTVPNKYSYPTGYEKRQGELQKFLGESLLNVDEIKD